MARRQWVSACESLTNSSIAASRENKESLANLLIESAKSFANEISKTEVLSSYDGRCVAKAYNVGREPESAISAINKVPEEDVNHWLLYEEAKAHLALGESHHHQALESAKICFEIAEGDVKAAKRVSIYHDLLSSCYAKLNDVENAVKELRKAVENCTDIEYRADLEFRLAGLTKC